MHQNFQADAVREGARLRYGLDVCVGDDSVTNVMILVEDFNAVGPLCCRYQRTLKSLTTAWSATGLRTLLRVVRESDFQHARRYLTLSQNVCHHLRRAPCGITSRA